jgi:hypothetical protein
MPVARTIVTFTIPAGQSISGGVDCTEGYLARIQMPPVWTPANISFQISDDNINYFDLIDHSNGLEAQVAVIPGTARMFQSDLWARGIGWWKIRSGSRDGPIVQTADRVFTVTLAPPGTL